MTAATFELHLLIARLADQTDPANGRRVTGPELDYYEAVDREIARAEMQLLLHGEAIVTPVDRPVGIS